MFETLRSLNFTFYLVANIYKHYTTENLDGADNIFVSYMYNIVKLF